MSSGQWRAPRSTVLRRDQAPQFRYIAVLVLALAAVVLAIAPPNSDWAHALVTALEGLALVVTVATSRERSSVRHRRWPWGSP
jgi:apolipoprotein N-acyltransferase